MSKTMKYAAAMPTRELIRAIPHGKSLSDAKIAESRGAAMVDATRAFYGKHRPAYVDSSNHPFFDDGLTRLMVIAL